MGGPGGRPTSDPKTRLLAVRLAQRHVQLLRSRAQSARVTLSEALRNLLDEHATPPQPPKSRPPTPNERQEFDQVFAAFGWRPRSRKKPRPPRDPPEETEA